MIVEIINVGTELLLGEIVNTNATYLQKMCKELGFDIYFQSVVGDNQERFKECLDIAFKRGANCIITTGGLGPTQDDLTKELSAEYLSLEMLYNEVEAKKVEDKCSFLIGSKIIPDNNFKQAYFPENCYILENDVGTANGCIMSKEDKMIINLPGPPKEMRYVIEHQLKPYLLQYKQDVLYTYEYITMGIGESTLDEVLADIIDHQKEVSIALYAMEEAVRIRLACKTSSQRLADVMMIEIKVIIEERLGEYIIYEKDVKEALYTIMPPYCIHYHSEFRLRKDFLLGCNASYQRGVTIDIDTKDHPLGQTVCVTLQHHEKQKYFEVPILKKADLSYAKLESKIIINTYQFLKSH